MGIPNYFQFLLAEALKEDSAIPTGNLHTLIPPSKKILISDAATLDVALAHRYCSRNPVAGPVGAFINNGPMLTHENLVEVQGESIAVARKAILDPLLNKGHIIVFLRDVPRLATLKANEAAKRARANALSKLAYSEAYYISLNTVAKKVPCATIF